MEKCGELRRFSVGRVREMLHRRSVANFLDGKITDPSYFIQNVTWPQQNVK